MSNERERSPFESGPRGGRRDGSSPESAGNAVDAEYERQSRLYVGLGTVFKTLKEKQKIRIARDLAAYVLEVMETDNLPENIELMGRFQPKYRQQDAYMMVQALVTSFHKNSDINENQVYYLDLCVHVFKFEAHPVIYLWDLIKSIRGMDIELEEKK
jgi:hypothetical protein